MTLISPATTVLHEIGDWKMYCIVVFVVTSNTFCRGTSAKQFSSCHFNSNVSKLENKLKTSTLGNV